MPNRLDRAADLADNLRNHALTRAHGAWYGSPTANYLAGAEDALRWVLGDVPEDTVTNALARLADQAARDAEARP